MKKCLNLLCTENNTKTYVDFCGKRLFLRPVKLRCLQWKKMSKMAKDISSMLYISTQKTKKKLIERKNHVRFSYAFSFFNNLIEKAQMFEEEG